MKNKVFVRFWKRDSLLSGDFIDAIYFQNSHIQRIITSISKFLSAHHSLSIVCISASSKFGNHETWPIYLIFGDLTVSEFINFVFSKTKCLRRNIVQICTFDKKNKPLYFLFLVYFFPSCLNLFLLRNKYLPVVKKFWDFFNV